MGRVSNLFWIKAELLVLLFTPLCVAAVTAIFGPHSRERVRCRIPFRQTSPMEARF